MTPKLRASVLETLNILSTVSILALIMMMGRSAQAADIVRLRAGAFPISSLVSVPPGGHLIYVSGVTAEPAAPGVPLGDTKTQTIAALRRIQVALKDNGASLGDIVMLRVFLVGDPALGGRMDFAGMMAGYSQFFGTPDQPNAPARTTVQVAGLAAPGALVEIEAQAAKFEVAKVEAAKLKP
jgi:enamine deaminase RidA (YjgF/YER057c/UK114 family)